MTTARHPDSGPDQRPDFMDSQEAAKALGISLDALRKSITRGTIEAVRDIAELRARVTSLEAQLGGGVKDQQTLTALNSTQRRPWWRLWG